MVSKERIKLLFPHPYTILNFVNPFLKIHLDTPILKMKTCNTFLKKITFLLLAHIEAKLKFRNLLKILNHLKNLTCSFL